MKVLLVFPRFAYQNFFAEPLSIFYLASILREEGFEFEVIDGTAETPESACAKMEEYRPDVLALSVHTVFAVFAKHLSGRFRVLNPKGVVIAGGPHPTILPEETLGSFADFVVMGEGEATLPELLRSLDRPDRVRGIAFLKRGKLVMTAGREPIKDLDSIPFPARDLMADKYYELGNAMLIASRGCPFNCSFCQPTLRKLFGEKFRQRSPGNVVGEIKYAKTVFEKKGYRLKSFSLTDDGITYNRKWLESFCRLLIKEKISLPWLGDSRADTLPDNELLRLMKESGCTSISIGVESGNDYTRNTILGKALPREKIVDAFRRCHEIGIEPHSFLMVGSPGESRKTIYDTVRLLDEIKPTTTQVTVTTPLPGTDLFKYCEDKSMNRAGAWSDYDYYVESHIELENFTRKQVGNLRAAMKFSILGRTFLKRYLGIEARYSTLYRLVTMPFATELLKQIEWGRLSGARRRLQAALGIKLNSA